MKWFDNPRKRHRKRKRKAPKGGWKKYMAKLRAMKGRKRRSRRSTGGHMARRKRSHKRSTRRRSHRRRRAATSVVVRSNPRRHRRRYRRYHNPRFPSARGIMGRVTQGAVDGIWIVGGKAVTNAIPSLIGLAPTGALGLGVKALSAVAAGYLFGMVSANAGKLATASGFASIYEPFVKGLNIPIVSQALADDDDYSYGLYPSDVGQISSYPEASGVGDTDDYAMQGQY